MWAESHVSKVGDAQLFLGLLGCLCHAPRAPAAIPLSKVYKDFIRTPSSSAGSFNRVLLQDACLTVGDSL